MRIPLITDWLEKRSLAKFDEYLDFLIDGQSSNSGANVTEKTALKSTAVFACVRILAETIASLPLPVYERLDPRGKKRAPQHPLYNLLHDAPNPYMTSFVFRETMMGHLATWGNLYAEIEWDSRARPKALWPLRPDRMKEIKHKNGKLVYVYRLPDGTDKVFQAYRIFHVPGLGFDGYVGYSPIAMAREAVGLSMSTEEFGARLFKNGAKPGGVLEHPQKLGKEAHDNLRKSWNEMHQGLSNQHRIAILEQGMTYKQIGIPPNDAQFLETRKFQTLEIARIYRIPPHMLADLERATFSNIEHQSIDFVVHTIRPWLVRWEQAIKQKLFVGNEKERYFAEFLVDGLLRGDTQSRYEAYAKGFQVGAFSVNDILELENRNPIGKDGDKRFVPMNMVPLDSVDDFKPKQSGEPEADRTLPPLETRSAAARNRFRLAKQYEGLFRDAGARIVAREVKDLKRAAKKMLKERDSTDFLVYLEDYYRKAPEWIEKTILPVFLSLGEAARDAAAQEIGADPADMNEWLSGYAERYGRQHAGSSEGQLRALITQAQTDAEDSYELIEERLGEWEEKRPGKIAQRETVELSNKVARFVFAGAGITRLRWVAVGSKSCPYCNELDGKVVGIDSPFLGGSESLESEDGRMRINKPAFTPQLHSGCECQIIPD